MKYIISSVLFTFSLLLASCGESEVGPFIVEIKTEESVDTPFIVGLMHTVGTMHGASLDYDENKIIYANIPTKFPAAKGISIHTPMSIEIYHPIYRSREHSSLSLLAPSVRDKKRGLVDMIYDNFTRPEKYEITVEMERKEKSLDNFVMTLIKNYGYSKEEADKTKTASIHKLINSIDGYKSLVVADYPDSNFEQIEKFFQGMIDSQITNSDEREKLLKILKENIHEKEN